ncbi:EAL domain-containing protein [Aestuariibacter halophilus]|uniref:EAL domain-containing protein n=1 Tax=Fluctibacter halophilus TaxID=226011 RepID=A0ABS8GAB3_9ALTE|nr:EAL domain-containing protein [Aestuariibacter halophilus]MCC2617530.1 EAL domain-containing protein [Aestuariibacter halophilus]
MTADIQAGNLSEEELRALIPQLQQLTEKYKRSELVQKALFDISELAGSVSELSRLYPAIHRTIGEFMNAENFFVAFFDQEKEVVDFVYFVDEFDEQTIRSIPAKELMGGITGFILRTGQHLVLTRENHQEVFASNNIKAYGKMPVDLIGVPLKRGNNVIGAMVVQSYDEAVRYSPDDLEVLLFVSQHIVNAVDRVKSRELTEQTIRERTKQLRNINEELQEEIHERQKIESLQQALFEISELAASLDGEMANFYSSLHDILGRLLSAPNCYIAILNKDKDHLDFPYYSDEITRDVESRPLGRGLTEYVLRTGRAELINFSRVAALRDDGELDEATAANMLKRSNSWLGSPLIVEGEISGVIAVQTYGADEQYTLKDLELLRFVSHHIAVAMERKRASDKLQMYNQQLADKVKERTDELHNTNLHLKKQIEERKQIELKLIHDAHHDALTGLPNRVMFNSRLELAIASKKRHTDQHYAVLFIDLDRFKLINDTLGHHAGDEFLIEVSKRIGKCIRGHDLLARLGGDEFVILLDSFDDFHDVEEVATRIIGSISTPFILDSKEMYSGASIGIAYIESGYQSADELIRDADAAMYQAKALGRGRFVMFDKSMRQKLLEELELENEFRRTLKSAKFECFIQPAMDIHTDKYLYHECFIRWEHPSIGKIKREQFWQVAEQSGLTIEIDNYMLEQACRILKHWQKSNGPERNYNVAINLSINHLMQNKLVNQLIEYIDKAQVDPKKLVFEFDENDLNRKSQFMLPAIRKLKRAGVTLVLDNFGSGLASLSYLYSYPFDFVKVDHRFVKSIPRSQRNLKLIQSVMVISEHLNFTLIAEGIENQEQLDALREVGCQYGQGKFLEQASVVDFQARNKSLTA